MQTTLTPLLIAFALTTTLAPTAAADDPATLSIEAREVRDAQPVFAACQDGWLLTFYQAVADHHLVAHDADGNAHDLGLVAAAAPHFYGASEASEACAGDEAQLIVDAELLTLHEPPIFPAVRIYDIQDAGNPTIVCTAGKKVSAVTATATYDVGYLDTEREYNSFLDGGIRNVPFLRTSITNQVCQ